MITQTKAIKSPTAQRSDKKTKKSAIKKNRLKFRIHPLFVLLGVFSFIIGSGVFFLIYTLSVFLHELGHMIVAERRGYKMKEIKLLPYGALLTGETDEFSFKDEVIIAISGPITNFILCGLCLAVWWLFPVTYNFSMDFCMANLVAGCFNLLPIYPLDGGRVLLGVLSCKLDRKLSAKIVKLITMIFSILLFVIFIASIFISINLSIGIMAALLFASSISESKNAVYERITAKFLREKQLRRGIQKRQFLVSQDISIEKLLKLQSKNYIAEYVVVDSGKNSLAVLTEDEVGDFLKNYGAGTTINDILKTM